MSSRGPSGQRGWRAWGTAPVTWREPVGNWTALGWLTGVLWPPFVLTLILWPHVVIDGGIVRDLSLMIMGAGAIGVAMILRLIGRERRRTGSPRTRLGVVMRFIAYGFIFSVLAVVGATFLAAGWALFGLGDLWRKLGEVKATLVQGLGLMPVFLVVGSSYAVWAGFMSSLIAFGPQAPKPAHALYDRLVAVAEPDPEPPSPPPPPPPRPETDLERALRADLD